MPLKDKPRRAGAYTDQRYKKARHNYRRKIRPILGGIFGPLILAGVAFMVVEGHRLTWIVGVVTGTLAAAWMVVRDEPPAYIEHWREGVIAT